jgi:hypothetical protein
MPTPQQLSSAISEEGEPRPYQQHRRGAARLIFAGGGVFGVRAVRSSPAIGGTATVAGWRSPSEFLSEWGRFRQFKQLPPAIPVLT